MSWLAMDDMHSNRRVERVELAAPKRFTIDKIIGHGSYGVVFSACDSVIGEEVAIKKLSNVFRNLARAKQALRELRILRHMKHENLVSITGVFLGGGADSFEDVYIVSNLVTTDLGTILQHGQALTEDHCQFFLYQILRGMRYVHSADVIHCDLKPSNLLVFPSCDLQICDFGMASVQQAEVETPAAQSRCTRWYRAPEILLCCEEYGKAVDMWSVGCIFAELYRREPLLAGRNTEHQVFLILNCLGTPSKDDLVGLPKKVGGMLLVNYPSQAGRRLREMLPQLHQDAMELLDGLLSFSPDHRLTVEAAIAFPYLKCFHCPHDEPTRSPLDPSDFDFERDDVDVDDIRREIVQEYLHYGCVREAESYRTHRFSFVRDSDSADSCSTAEPTSPLSMISN